MEIVAYLSFLAIGIAGAMLLRVRFQKSIKNRQKKIEEDLANPVTRAEVLQKLDNDKKRTMKHLSSYLTVMPWFGFALSVAITIIGIVSSYWLFQKISKRPFGTFKQELGFLSLYAGPVLAVSGIIGAIRFVSLILKNYGRKEQ